MGQGGKPHHHRIFRNKSILDEYICTSMGHNADTQDCDRLGVDRTAFSAKRKLPHKVPGEIARIIKI